MYSCLTFSAMSSGSHRVLIAPDELKGTPSAIGVGSCLAEGLRSAALEAVRKRWAGQLHAVASAAALAAPGTRAAGQTGFADLALGGDLRNGAGLFLDLADFDRALTRAELVLNGEGPLDDQPLLGKAPAEVAARARSVEVPAIAVAGSRCEALSDTALERHRSSEVHESVEVSPTAAADLPAPRRGLLAIGRRIAASRCRSTPSQNRSNTSCR